ncbi:MAG: phosphatase PAP2 family protein [Puia sp.]
MARVYADYHPDSKLKWVFYSAAGALTAATGLMRNLAGMHFLSDVLLGAAVGTASGLLVPSLHKIKPGKTPHLTILPFGGGGGRFYCHLSNLRESLRHINGLQRSKG